MSALVSPDADGNLATVEYGGGPTIEQVAPPHPDLFGVEVASHLTLPLAGGATGALALGHTVARARGFTSPCQRIGRAIADAAELLLSQPLAREQLSTERDLLARLVRTDALTGGANRRAWDDEITSRGVAVEHDDAYVMLCDLDGLKTVNNRYGHAAGDALIRAASNLLRSSVRETDLVARVGGDEFVVLLTPRTRPARRVVARVRRALRAWRVTEHGLVPQLSVGLAPVVGGDLEGARAVADQAMYASRRRRSANKPSPAGGGSTDRRRANGRGSAPGRSPMKRIRE
ncbi:MAG: GGDEF domain-containing protein [Chloroflexota bacterium]|nr:GGDEF domain-containing protein [Chloroflexota bacterium]